MVQSSTTLFIHINHLDMIPLNPHPVTVDWGGICPAIPVEISAKTTSRTDPMTTVGVYFFYVFIFFLMCFYLFLFVPIFFLCCDYFILFFLICFNVFLLVGKLIRYPPNRLLFPSQENSQSDERDQLLFRMSHKDTHQERDQLLFQ